MRQTVSRLLPELPLFLMTAVTTHLVMSFSQTLMHYKIGHHPMGGKLFRNHINFHHTYYSKDHLVSRMYLGDEGNNTPFFFSPVFLVGACTYFLLPFDLFVVQIVACAASFYAHVFFDREYHVEGSRLQRFAWFRRKQELHFVHHRHANSKFAVIHFFWDRILCTYRGPAGDISRLNRFQENEFEPWLSGEAGTELLKPAANDVLERWPVSKRVNSSRASDDDAELTDKIELPTIVLS
jgi:hypothetical protein